MTTRLRDARVLLYSHDTFGLGHLRRSRAIANAIVPAITPAIIVSGIVFGVFTPTEAAAVAALHALILAGIVYRALSLKALY